MQKANKRLIFSIVALVVAIVMVTSTTYAWFTISTNPKVEDFQLDILTGSGIYVSLDGIKWSTSISTTDLRDNVPFKNVVLEPVTVDGDYNASFMNATKFSLKNMDFIAAESYDPDLALAEFGTPALKPKFSYYAFPLYLRSLDQYKVYLDTREGSTSIKDVDVLKSQTMPGSIYTLGDITSFGSDTKYSTLNVGDIESSFAFQAGASDTARVGIVPQTGTGYSIYNLRKGLATEGWVYNGAVSAKALKNVAHTLWNNDDSNLPLTDRQKELDISNEYKQYAATASPAASFIANNPVAANLTETGKVYNVASSSDKYYVSVVTVFIWLEGKDTDCFEALTGNKLNISLFFYGDFVAAAGSKSTVDFIDAHATDKADVSSLYKQYTPYFGL